MSAEVATTVSSFPAGSPTVTEIEARSGWFDLDFAGVWRYRELLWFLVLRDVKVRYKQAALGTAWALIQPLLTVAIFTLIFGLFARMPSQGIPYPLFAFSAMLPWAYFSEAARRTSLGLVGDAALISKVYFPRLVVPIANALTPLADFVVAFVVFLGMMEWYGFEPHWQILFVVPLLLISLLLAVAVGLWLAPLNVRYRDITHTLPFLLQLWMYATPIVYPLTLVPERWRTLYSLNPTVGLIEGFRWAMLGLGSPDWRAMGIGFAGIIVTLAGGLVFFRRCERKFADIL